jgi:hypothetical protein
MDRLRCALTVVLGHFDVERSAGGAVPMYASDCRQGPACRGVFFRASVRRRASRLGVIGWVSDRSAGAVEAVFEVPGGGRADARVRPAGSGPPPRSRTSSIRGASRGTFPISASNVGFESGCCAWQRAVAIVTTMQRDAHPPREPPRSPLARLARSRPSCAPRPARADAPHNWMQLVKFSRRRATGYVINLASTRRPRRAPASTTAAPRARLLRRRHEQLPLEPVTGPSRRPTDTPVSRPPASWS